MALYKGLNPDLQVFEHSNVYVMKHIRPVHVLGFQMWKIQKIHVTGHVLMD
jgi:hypothetical protein